MGGYVKWVVCRCVVSLEKVSLMGSLDSGVQFLYDAYSANAGHKGKIAVVGLRKKGRKI